MDAAGTLMKPHPAKNADGTKVLWVSAKPQCRAVAAQWRAVAGTPCAPPWLCRLHAAGRQRDTRRRARHPAAPSNPQQLWDRGSNTWKDIHTSTNSICGGWAKLANGHIGMFAGHYQTMGVSGLWLAVRQQYPRVTSVRLGGGQQHPLHWEAGGQHSLQSNKHAAARIRLASGLRLAPHLLRTLITTFCRHCSSSRRLA